MQVAKENLQVNEHAHTYQEIRYEQGIAHELDIGHKRRGAGYEPVNRKTCQKRSQQTFQACQFSQCGTEENQRQDEDELHDGLIVSAQEPAAYSGIGIYDKTAIQHTLEGKEHPVHPVGVLKCANGNGKHQQGNEKRHCCGHHGDYHHGVTGKAEAAHDGIRNQRVRCQYAAEQNGTGGAKAQKMVCSKETHGKGYHIGDDTKEESPAPILPHTAHVHLQCGKEHDEVDAYLTEYLKTPVPLYDIETMLAYHHTCQYQAYDMGCAQTAKKDRGKKDYHQYDKKHPSWVGDQSQGHLYECRYLKHVQC